MSDRQAFIMAARRLEVSPGFLEKVLTEVGILASPEAREGDRVRRLARRQAADAIRRRAGVLSVEPELSHELREVANSLERRGT